MTPTTDPTAAREASMTAEELLLAINPCVPALVDKGAQDWSLMRPLKSDVGEFSWTGAKLLPEVKRLLANASAALSLMEENRAVNSARERNHACEVLPKVREALQMWVDHFDELDRKASPGDPLNAGRMAYHRDRIKATREALELFERGGK